MKRDRLAVGMRTSASRRGRHSPLPNRESATRPGESCANRHISRCVADGRSEVDSERKMMVRNSTAIAATKIHASGSRWREAGRPKKNAQFSGKFLGTPWRGGPRRGQVMRRRATLSCRRTEWCRAHVGGARRFEVTKSFHCVLVGVRDGGRLRDT